ncbi:hypothetical protein P2W68_21500 [Chryseobacterium arthrosphaerae]|uniref:hypothetical protein n=1 Tax=Chryseobacterium arthrosphaerae TaxID=651561 RepID=UPI0023E0AD5F|nr:hypothetical protein [Chryseobacterium arthrosphaerae]WES97375.1 hypothetical protein P2W68_21500 [Chryseobacterium arthrosphaerae]
MINCYTIIKDSSLYYFFNDDGSVLFKVNREFKFPKYLFTIKDNEDRDILIFEVRNILFSKTKIIYQNFEKRVVFKEKNKLFLKDTVISIIDNSKILGKYKSIITVNNQIIGEIKEEHIFPYKKYFIKFNMDNNVNYYCIILFAMISIHFADGI